jgi:hypothetical protein
MFGKGFDETYYVGHMIHLPENEPAYKLLKQEDNYKLNKLEEDPED